MPKYGKVIVLEIDNPQTIGKVTSLVCNPYNATSDTGGLETQHLKRSQKNIKQKVVWVNWFMFLLLIQKLPSFHLP